MGLKFVFGDHLGSSTRTADISGGSAERQLYKAWGETRSAGTVGTKYQYTGQYSYTTDFGLHFYRSRWFDSLLGRFAQADTIVPLASQGVQAYDRYAGMNNNSIRYTDPSGNNICDDDGNYCFNQGKLVKGNEKEWGEMVAFTILSQTQSWMMKLIALAVYAESSNGTYPIEAMVLAAQVFANRAKSSLWSGPYKYWNMLMGKQSALSALYTPKWNPDTKKFEAIFPLPRELDRFAWNSLAELQAWVESSWARGMAGKLASGYHASLLAAQEGWLAQSGASTRNPAINSSILYFSHQSESTQMDINSRRDEILEQVNGRSAIDQAFQFASVGPFYSTKQKYHIFMIASNDSICGQEGYCK